MTAGPAGLDGIHSRCHKETRWSIPIILHSVPCTLLFIYSSEEITQHYIPASSLRLIWTPDPGLYLPPGKRDEETSINTLHLFDLRCTWSKAEGNSACRIIYALFMEKHSSHDIADCSVACNSYTACLLLHNFAGEPSLIENAWTGCCSERIKQPICAIMFSR